MDCMMNVGSLLLYVVMHIIIMQDESRVTAFLPIEVTSVTIFYIQVNKSISNFTGSLVSNIMVVFMNFEKVV